jgi:hypothetical protein
VGVHLVAALRRRPPAAHHQLPDHRRQAGRHPAFLPLVVASAAHPALHRARAGRPARPRLRPPGPRRGCRALARLPWSIFVGEHLPVEASWSERLGAEVIARDGNPLLRASSGGWDGFLAAQSAHFRKRLRWQERQLARHHRVAYRLVQDGEQLPAALDTLFRLHQLRWPPGSSAFQPRAAFHREFAAMALERGWLRLWILELDGQPAAALYGFRFGAVESHYQGGRDPVFDRLSLGFVLLAHAIRQALDDGVAEYRFLHGHDAYKYRFADDDPGLETITLTRGMAGRAALSAARSAYPRLKHRLGRWKWMIT